MKKNKWIIVVMIVFVVALIAAVVGIHCWYNSGNIRVMGDELRVDLEGIGYIIDASTGEITGQTPIAAVGKTLESDSSVFNGELEVLGYVNETDGTITTSQVVTEGKNGLWEIHCLESCLHYEEDSSGATEPVEHLCDYYYVFYVYPEDQDFMVVCVESFEEDELVYIVLADSEDQALETYQWFLEHKA